jgi:hypothetical protein
LPLFVTLAQALPQQLAVRSLRQRLDARVDARALVARKAAGNVVLQFGGFDRPRRDVERGDDRGVGLDPHLRGRAFEDRGMGVQRAFDLDGRNPDADPR